MMLVHFAFFFSLSFFYFNRRFSFSQPHRFVRTSLIMFSEVIDDTISSSSDNSRGVEEDKRFPRLYFGRKASFKSGVKFFNLKFKAMRAENPRSVSRNKSTTTTSKGFQANESSSRNKFSIDNILGQLKKSDGDEDRESGSDDDMDLEDRSIANGEDDDRVKVPVLDYGNGKYYNTIVTKGGIVG
jgi:hypothetical protein